MPPVFATV